jgi:2-oxoglutarate ferredoxin oxidoreductase subunit delta
MLLELPEACESPIVGVFVAAKGRVSIVVERCKACGFCVEFCPTKVLALSSAFNSKGYHPPHVVVPEKCSGCDLCGMYCPDFAIYGHRVEAPKSDKNEKTTAGKTAAEASQDTQRGQGALQPQQAKTGLAGDPGLAAAGGSPALPAAEVKA